MPDRDPPNPYLEMPVSMVADALHERAGKLLRGGQVGRRDTAYLLIVAGNHLRPRIGSPGAPTAQVRSGASTPEQAFGPLLADEQRSLRWRLVKQAMEAAGWPVVGHQGRLAERALEGDEAFLEVLREIGRGLS